MEHRCRHHYEVRFPLPDTPPFSLRLLPNLSYLSAFISPPSRFPTCPSISPRPQEHVLSCIKVQRRCLTVEHRCRHQYGVPSPLRTPACLAATPFFPPLPIDTCLRLFISPSSVPLPSSVPFSSRPIINAATTSSTCSSLALTAVASRQPPAQL